MAEPNKLRITRTEQGTEVLVSDAQGVVHDISGKFRWLYEDPENKDKLTAFKGRLWLKNIDPRGQESLNEEISGTTTPAGFTNCFRAQDDGTVVEVNFTAVDKELNYTLKPEAAKQIAALAE